MYSPPLAYEADFILLDYTPPLPGEADFLLSQVSDVLLPSIITEVYSPDIGVKIKSDINLLPATTDVRSPDCDVEIPHSAILNLSNPAKVDVKGVDLGLQRGKNIPLEIPWGEVPSYIPPPPNEADFELEQENPPGPHFADFELSVTEGSGVRSSVHVSSVSLSIIAGDGQVLYLLPATTDVYAADTDIDAAFSSIVMLPNPSKADVRGVSLGLSTGKNISIQPPWGDLSEDPISIQQYNHGRWNTGGEIRPKVSVEVYCYDVGVEAIGFRIFYSSLQSSISITI